VQILTLTVCRCRTRDWFTGKGIELFGVPPLDEGDHYHITGMKWPR